MPLPVPDLNLLRTFVAVAAAGSFTAAAERLGVTRPQVSQQIRKLESALGIQLLRRTTRQVGLTQEGRFLYERCAPLLGDIDSSLARLGNTQPELSGTLRIGAPIDHAAQVIAPMAAEFSRAHPLLKIDLRASDHIQDLIAEGIDVSIRIGWLQDSSMRVTKLADFHQVVLASAGYLARSRPIGAPGDLANHQWIELSLLRAPLTWTFERGGEKVPVRMSARLKTDSPTVLRSWLMAGAGISVASLHAFSRELSEGVLVRVLPDWQLPSGGIFAVYPPGTHISSSSRAFVEFLRARMHAAR